MKNTHLSKHFSLGEFCNPNKYPDNVPTMQAVANMTYGCLMLLEPARLEVGPILINSGYRNSRVNSLVGGVSNSQHLIGQAADIRPQDPAQLQRLVAFLKSAHLKRDVLNLGHFAQQVIVDVNGETRISCDILCDEFE
jgi:hypothetical protein